MADNLFCHCLHGTFVQCLQDGYVMVTVICKCLLDCFKFRRGHHPVDVEYRWNIKKFPIFN